MGRIGTVLQSHLQLASKQQRLIAASFLSLCFPAKKPPAPYLWEAQCRAGQTVIARVFTHTPGWHSVGPDRTNLEFSHDSPKQAQTEPGVSIVEG